MLAFVRNWLGNSQPINMRGGKCSVECHFCKILYQAEIVSLSPVAEGPKPETVSRVSQCTACGKQNVCKVTIYKRRPDDYVWAADWPHKLSHDSSRLQARR